MLFFFSSPSFYTNNVCLPHENDRISPYITNNPKFFPFFKGCLGAIDGTHIACNPTAAEQHANRDRKGTVTQNCLAICNFEMKFLYMFPGWDGSTSDSTMFHDARITDLPVLPERYYLADAGFPTTESLLLPFRGGIRYHLAEWQRADLR
jgi:DDE superfamily endonuclease